MTPEERITAAAHDVLEVARMSGLDLAELEAEIRAAPSRLIWRRAESRAEARQFTSHHEAGHAVACEVLRIPYSVAAIGVEDASRQPTLGRVVLDDAVPAGLAAVIDYLTMLGAGAAAESRSGNGSPAADLDNLLAVRIASRLGLSDAARRELQDLAGCLAIDLVRSHWVWITRVADALMSASRLTSAEVAALRIDPIEAAA